MSYEIIQGDNLDILKSYPDNSFDTIITSPPYNKKGLRGGVRTCENIWQGSNVDYGVYDDDMPEAEYQQWQIRLMDEFLRVIKPTGSIFYQHKIRNWARQGYHPMSWLSQCKAPFYQEIIWHRRSTMAMDERYLFNTTERIYWFCKDKPKVYKDQLPEAYRSDVWAIPPARNNPHPAPFPEQLVENCILLTTQPGDSVLDPFMGSGTVLQVAERLDRTSVGCELDANYVAMAESRLNKHATFNELFDYAT